MAELGTIIGLIKTFAPQVDPEEIEQAVSDWLDDHPEATTTVEDGSITKAKLDSDLQDTVDDVQSLKTQINSKANESYFEELAEKGFFVEDETIVYFQLTSGMINNPHADAVEGKIMENSYTGYVAIPKENIPANGLLYDNTKYKVNTFFSKDGYGVDSTYTAWQTTSPVQYTVPSADWDMLWLNVRKQDSSDYSESELNSALYARITPIIGNLATKEYVNGFNPKGRKCIYPDGFDSRIKPDIYFNGKYYADIDVNDYKISGAGDVWVATDGDDTNGDGSENAPFLTVGKAKNNGSKTIHFKPGTYLQGTHYSSGTDLSDRNYIGHGIVVFQHNQNGGYIYATSNSYVENIIFKHSGAGSQASFNAECSASGKRICFVNCAFVNAAGSGLAVMGMDAILIKCVAYGNKLDGFNYHKKTVSGSDVIPNAFEMDCMAYNNGNENEASCNGSTIHDGERIVRVNCEYYSCHGGVVADIGGANSGDPTTKSVNFGVLSHDSTGTGEYSASFWASYNTEMYMYDCMSYGGTYDISAINDAKVVSWRLTTGRDEPSVNKAETADVVIH